MKLSAADHRIAFDGSYSTQRRIKWILRAWIRPQLMECGAEFCLAWSMDYCWRAFHLTFCLSRKGRNPCLVFVWISSLFQWLGFSISSLARIFQGKAYISESGKHVSVTCTQFVSTEFTYPPEKTDVIAFIRCQNYQDAILKKVRTNVKIFFVFL